MHEKVNCPRCGEMTVTELACEHCGYTLQDTEQGGMEVRLPEVGGEGRKRRVVRFNPKLMLVWGGILVLTMCICPQPWFYLAEWMDSTFGRQGNFTSFSNAMSAALLVCPLVYGVVLVIGLFKISAPRRKR